MFAVAVRFATRRGHWIVVSVVRVTVRSPAAAAAARAACGLPGSADPRTRLGAVFGAGDASGGAGLWCSVRAAGGICLAPAIEGAASTRPAPNTAVKTKKTGRRGNGIGSREGRDPGAPRSMSDPHGESYADEGAAPGETRAPQQT